MDQLTMSLEAALSGVVWLDNIAHLPRNKPLKMLAKVTEGDLEKIAQTRTVYAFRQPRTGKPIAFVEIQL